MTLFLWVIVYLLLSVVVLATVFFGIVMFLNIFLSAPFLSSSREVIYKLTHEIDLSGKKVFYDLGCGSGKVLSKLAQKYPKMECIGIELNPVALFLAKFRNLFLKNKVKYLYQSFYSTNLSKADVVYTYLFPEPMKRLQTKFRKELKSGTIVISIAFKLPDKKPYKVIKGRKSILSTLYIYKY